MFLASTMKGALEIQSKFISLVNSSPQLHGEWVPSIYWVWKLNEELLQSGEKATIKESKFVRAIESLCSMDLTADKERFGCMSRVIYTQKRLDQRRVSSVFTANRTKKRNFFCVLTPLTDHTAGDFPVDCKSETITAVLQGLYNKYANNPPL